MQKAWHFFLLFISKCTISFCQGGLEVDVLSAGGSWQDGILHLAADGEHQYIVGAFNEGNEDPLGGTHKTISVAKVGENLTEWEGLHGHLSCDKTNMLNCTQILDDRELIMSSVTGLVAVNGDAILSGCYRSFFEEPMAGCASVVNPTKWRVMGHSESCVNMQGGLTLYNGNVFVAGLFYDRVEFFQVNDETGKNKSFGGPLIADGLGAFFLEIDPDTGLIESFGRDPNAAALVPLFIAGGPRENFAVYILSKKVGHTKPLPATCPEERSGGGFASNGVVLTPLGFHGEGSFFFTEGPSDEFEPTGMVVDPADPAVVYVSGYFKGVLKLFDNNEVASAPRRDPSQNSIDGILMKIEFNHSNNKTVPSIDWVLRIGGPGEDKALGVTAKDGKVYVVGTFEFDLEVDGWLTRKDHKGKPLLLKVELNMDQVASRGDLDVFVLKLLSKGMNVQWVSTAGGELDDFVTSIDLGANGDLHVGGRFSGVSLFPGDKMLVSQGMFDAFVATYKEVQDWAGHDSSTPNDPSGVDAWRASSAAVLAVVSACLVLASVLYCKRKHAQKKKIRRRQQELEQNSGLMGIHRLRVVTGVLDFRSNDDGSG